VTLHRSARTCPRSRKLSVDRVVSDGWSIREAAECPGRRSALGLQVAQARPRGRPSGPGRPFLGAVRRGPRLSASRRFWACASCGSPRLRSPKRSGWRTRRSRRCSSAKGAAGCRDRMATSPRTATSALVPASSSTSMSKSSAGSPASGTGSPAIAARAAGTPAAAARAEDGRQSTAAQLGCIARHRPLPYVERDNLGHALLAAGGRRKPTHGSCRRWTVSGESVADLEDGACSTRRRAGARHVGLLWRGIWEGDQYGVRKHAAGDSRRASDRG
jgi:hypothetical protein